MKIECLVAMSENRVIGIDNQLPWHLSDDLKNFKRITMGKAILMGRRTYESIGRPLPGRTNIILTRDPAFVAPSCMVVNSLDEAMELADSLGSLVIIGGQTIYEQFIDKVDILHVTLVHTTLEGDAYFPTIGNGWEECIGSTHPQNNKNDHSFTYKTYTKLNTDSIQQAR